ncbi:hypothetical protein SCHPADRAFT_719873 [Schizopora paradoxa]|uniref:Uncharacterized protein n=1 Tax=Schizopora paradoxa TaxID=27342 RepID=A0A0H2R1J8_9AGAM|nr:hypothetical protein SCHPADRAFT_719873 [Schizopora paradoxa]
MSHFLLCTTMSERPKATRNALMGNSLIKRNNLGGVVQDGLPASSPRFVSKSTQLARDIVLRDSKYDMTGSGQLGRQKSLAGQQKLEILARYTVDVEERQMNKGSVRAAFCLDHLLRSAQSQKDALLDAIDELHDPALFRTAVIQHLHPRMLAQSSSSGKLKWQLQHGQKLLNHVHETYMSASAWSILHDALTELELSCLDNRNILGQLKASQGLRTMYFRAIAISEGIMELGLNRVRAVTQTSPHFSQYFTTQHGVVKLNNAMVYSMYKSFLDSTIMELCFPKSHYTPSTLYRCIAYLEEEKSKHLSECSQEMWNAIGDLSIILQIKDQLDTPFLGEEGKSWKVDAMRASEKDLTLEKWINAQKESLELPQKVVPPDLLHCESSVVESALHGFWKNINSYFSTISSGSIEGHWGILRGSDRLPLWTQSSSPGTNSEGSDKTKSNTVSNIESLTHRPYSIVNADVEGLTGSVPDLIRMEDLDPEGNGAKMALEDALQSIMGDNYEDDSEVEDCDGVSEYDSGDEGLMGSFRNAMNVYSEDPDAFEVGEKMDPEESGYDGRAIVANSSNIFINIMKRWKDRCFESSESPVRVCDLSCSGFDTKAWVSEDQGTKTFSGENEGNVNACDTGKSRAAACDADDRERAMGCESVLDTFPKPIAKKKKNKKKSKKRREVAVDSVAFGEDPAVIREGPVESVVKTNAQVNPTEATEFIQPIVEVEVVSTPNPAAPQSVNINPTDGFEPRIETSQMPDATEQGSMPDLRARPDAVNERSKASDVQVKVKVKTRPELSTSGDHTEEPNVSSGARKSRRNRKSKAADSEGRKDAGNGVFGQLKQKTLRFARRLFGVSVEDRKGPLKWPHFVQMMQELGFKCDPSTAGSSVRFDPPSTKDRSISFHKPHPDPTLQQYHIQAFRKKLLTYYSWSPDELKMMERSFQL